MKALYQKALRFHKRGELDRAGRAYEKLLRRDPDHVGALCHLALLAGGSGRLDLGVELLSRAVRLDPANVDAHNNLGIMLRRQGRVAEAAAAFRRALAVDPDFASAHFNLGNALLASGEPAGAVDGFRAVTRIRPSDARGWAGLGSALVDSGRSDEGIPALRESLRLDPAASFARNELGVAYIQVGKFESAAECFRQVLAAEPANTHACLNLVRTRRARNARDPDIGLVERALREGGMAPEAESEVRFALGKLLDDCGRFDEAIAQFHVANRTLRPAFPFDGAARALQVQALESTFSAELFERLAGVGDPSEQPVFIVGMPRSGTTLVEQVVATHPRAGGAGELPYMVRYAEGLDGALGVPAPYPACVEALDRATAERLAADYLARLHERVDPEAWRITDKMPSNWVALGLVAVLFPRARVVHCRRDPRDTAVSIYFQRFTEGHAYSYDLDDIATEYRAYTRLMAHWSRVLPLPVLEVDYEALVGDFERQARRLIEFLDLPWDDGCLRFHESSREVRTASAWQVRQPIYGHAAGRWRNYRAHLSEVFDRLMRHAPVRAPGGSAREP